MGNFDSILVLTTGGTIDKQYFDALSKYQITDSIVTRLLEVARVRHPYQVEEVLRKDSIDITEEDRAQIVEHVRRATFSRIVITHGTDTMTVTASALADIADPRPSCSPAHWLRPDSLKVTRPSTSAWRLRPFRRRPPGCTSPSTARCFVGTPSSRTMTSATSPASRASRVQKVRVSVRRAISGSKGCWWMSARPSG